MSQKTLDKIADLATAAVCLFALAYFYGHVALWAWNGFPIKH